MRPTILKKLSLSLLITVLYSQSAHAFEVGEIKVKSYNNEPLIASILLTGEPNELLGITASAKIVGSKNELSTQFIPATSDAPASLLIRSANALVEPILEIELDLRDSKTRLSKTYTVFTDPNPAGVALPVRPSPALPSTTTIVSKTSSSITTSNSPVTTMYKVKRGDTLSKIAKRFYGPQGLRLSMAVSLIANANPVIVSKKMMIRAGSALSIPGIPSTSEHPVTRIMTEKKTVTRQKVTTAPTNTVVINSGYVQTIPDYPTPKRAVATELKTNESRAIQEKIKALELEVGVLKQEIASKK